MINLPSAHFPGNQGLQFSFAERGDVVAELAAAKQEIMELRAQLLAMASVASAMNRMRIVHDAVHHAAPYDWHGARFSK